MCILLYGLLAVAICSRAGEKSEISIKIQPVRASVFSGSNLGVRVEITNQSDHDLLLSRESGDEISAPVGIFFEIRNSKGAFVPGTAHAGDCVMKSEPGPLPIAVLKYWVALPPKTSLVFKVNLRRSAFLSKADTYSVIAHYESIGLKEESWTHCVNTTQSELAKLPFGAFEGTIKSNQITITVLRSDRRKSTN